MTVQNDAAALVLQGVPLERVIENTRFTAFSYQFELFNQPF
jgi:hypothetical protein